MDLSEGGLDGLFTTVEWSIDNIKDKINEANPFAQADATTNHHTGVDNKVNDAAFKNVVFAKHKCERPRRIL